MENPFGNGWVFFIHWCYATPDADCGNSLHPHHNPPVPGARFGDAEFFGSGFHQRVDEIVGVLFSPREIGSRDVEPLPGLELLNQDAHKMFFAEGAHAQFAGFFIRY